MRVVKIIIWLVLLMVLETVFGSLFSIKGAMPDLLAAFAVAYCIHERRLQVAAYIMLACGIITGSEPGKSFLVEVLVCAGAGLLAYGARRRMKFIPAWIKSCILTAAAAFVVAAVQYLTNAGDAISIQGLIYSILPKTIYTFAAGLALYPLTGITLFREKESGRLLKVI